MGNPYDPYGQQQPPAYGQQQQYPQQQPPPFQQTPPPQAYPAQPAFPAAAQPQYGVPQQGYGPGYGQYAGWGSRVYAYIIDALVYGIVPGVLYIVGFIIVAAGTADAVNDCAYSTTGYCEPSSGAAGASVLGFLLIMAGGILGLVLGLMMLHKQGTTGQTIGKRQAGIKLVSGVTGQPIGFGGAFVRQLAHALEFGIGWLWPLFDDKRQTFADKICNTVVIRVH